MSQQRAGQSLVSSPLHRLLATQRCDERGGGGGGGGKGGVGDGSRGVGLGGGSYSLKPTYIAKRQGMCVYVWGGGGGGGGGRTMTHQLLITISAKREREGKTFMCTNSFQKTRHRVVTLVMVG